MTARAIARVAPDGRLIMADPPILSLQEAAGGSADGVLVVPGLAGIARLARSLSTPVARMVLAAAGNVDVELHVHASLDGDDVVLVADGWSPRPRRKARLSDDATPGTTASPAATAGFAVDAKMRITALEGGEGAIGLPIGAVFRLIETADGALPILAALAARRSFANQPAVLRDVPDQELVLSGQPIIDANGHFAGYRGIAEASEIVGEAPEKQTAEAGPLADADFASQLRQALRAPLGRILENADEIAGHAAGPLRRDYSEYAGDIASAARHLLALVDDLTDLQSVEGDTLDLDIEKLDLADLGRRAAGILQVRASDAGVRIDRPASDETLPARGDYRRVLQILINLIGNAIRYSPEGGMIWLRAEHDGENAVIIVADQGKGIDASDQERIFAKFERVDPGEPGGSGLGLYIARRLARAMGGDITVDSAPGQGARFALTLPVSAD